MYLDVYDNCLCWVHWWDYARAIAIYVYPRSDKVYRSNLTYIFFYLERESDDCAGRHHLQLPHLEAACIHREPVASTRPSVHLVCCLWSFRELSSSNGPLFSALYASHLIGNSHHHTKWFNYRNYYKRSSGLPEHHHVSFSLIFLFKMRDNFYLNID